MPLLSPRSISMLAFAFAAASSVAFVACSDDDAADPKAAGDVDDAAAGGDGANASEAGTGADAASSLDATNDSPGDAPLGDACSVADAGIGTVCATETDCTCGNICGPLRCVRRSKCDEGLLVWNGPVTNADGTCVTTLAGFNVYWSLDGGTDANIDGGPFRADAGYDCVPGPLTACGDAGMMLPMPVCTYRVTDLENGNWVFTTTAYDDAGLESAPSAPASKTIACP